MAELYFIVLFVFSDVPLPFTAGSSSSMPVFSSSKETSSIVVEKKNEITSPLRESSVRFSKDNSRSMQDMSDAKSTKSSEVTTVVASEKQPDAVSASSSGETALQQAADSAKSSREELVCQKVSEA